MLNIDANVNLKCENTLRMFCGLTGCLFLIIRTDWDDEDDDPSTFEAELAMLDEYEAETHQDRIGKTQHFIPKATSCVREEVEKCTSC